jgi:hypothetical protein
VAHPMVLALSCQAGLSPGTKAAFLSGDALVQLCPWAGWHLVHGTVVPQEVGLRRVAAQRLVCAVLHTRPCDSLLHPALVTDTAACSDASCVYETCRGLFAAT